MIMKRHSFFQKELFSHNKCFSVNDQNVHRLATEIYKAAYDLSVGDFENFFDFRNKYTLYIPLINIELKGKNSISLVRQFGMLF